MFWKKKKATRYKPKKKMEFSKKWLITTFVLTGVVVVVSFVCVIKSGELGIIDLSPITVICTSAFASLSVASLSYFRKAQAENVLKISKQIQEENIDVQNVEVALDTNNRIVVDETFGEQPTWRECGVYPSSVAETGITFTCTTTPTSDLTFKVTSFTV